jgi:osmotically-inducible protein OsmY
MWAAAMRLPRNPFPGLTLSPERVAFASFHEREQIMAQDRGRWSDYGGERRGDYETDDLRYRGRSGGNYESGRGQQRGEAFSRGGWSGERSDYGSGRQSGGWFGGDYESRGYGQGGYGAQEERYRGGYGSQMGGGGSDRDYDRGGFMSGGGYAGGGMGSSFPYGDRMGGYGQGGGSYPNSRQGWSSAGRRNYGDHERGFMEKAGDEVASWFGDEEAEQRRRQDQHHRGRGPRGYARSDERIREDINDRLTDDWMLDASDIEVEVNEREVTLSGHVSSRSDKRRAEDIAEQVSGVTHVQNNLRVRTNAESGGVTGVTL